MISDNNSKGENTQTVQPAQQIFNLSSLNTKKNMFETSETRHVSSRQPNRTINAQTQEKDEDELTENNQQLNNLFKANYFDCMIKTMSSHVLPHDHYTLSQNKRCLQYKPKPKKSNLIHSKKLVLIKNEQESPKIPQKSPQARKYSIKYQIIQIKINTNEVIDINQGQFEISNLNPYNASLADCLFSKITKQKILKKILIQTVTHFIINQVDKLIQIKGKCLIQQTILIKQKITTNDIYSCICINFCNNQNGIFNGLCIRSQLIQAKWNKPIKCNSLDKIKQSININGYTINIQLKILRSVIIIFHYLQLCNIDQFIDFLQQTNPKLFKYMQNMFYDHYLKLGIVTIDYKL